MRQRPVTSNLSKMEDDASESHPPTKSVEGNIYIEYSCWDDENSISTIQIVDHVTIQVERYKGND